MRGRNGVRKEGMSVDVLGVTFEGRGKGMRSEDFRFEGEERVNEAA